MPADATELDVRFPSMTGDGPTQDREFCDVAIDGELRRIRFHDYDGIFSVPGLYEHIFHDHLQCTSPQTVGELLGEELRAGDADPAELRALDVGAGNGMVGEELADLGIRTIVGVDIIPAAASAAERDRPAVYDDYEVCDLTALSADQRESLADREFTCMTTVAALGFDDIPPRAFAEAFNLVQEGGWVAFNIKEDFLDGADQTGFRRLIARMLSGGIVEERARRRYRHRLSVTGEPLRYVAVVGVKCADVPLELAPTR